MNELLPGDIFATRGRGIAGWAVRTLVSPPTDRFHFGLIWMKADGDYIILESRAPKGLRVAKLSWYEPRDVEVYRVHCPKKLRRQVPYEVIDLSPGIYDHLLLVKFLIGGIIAFLRILFKERRVRRLTAKDLPYVENSLPICTEVVDVGYDCVGVNLIAPGVAPIPGEFKRAELQKKMTKIVG